MSESLGYSVYLTSFDQQREMLERSAGADAMVFLSLHISEEFSPDYCARAERVCLWLHEAGFRTIADVSVKTVAQFGEPDLIRLAKRLRVWALRIDYGFTEEETAALAAQIPIVVNASTATARAARRIAAAGPLVMAMHNFYPRPETGLDAAFLLESTRALQEAGLKVLAFVPGDQSLRGPVHCGLPTLEAHRGQLPSACFADMVLRFGMDGVFVGDPGLSETEQGRVRRFCQEGVLSVPALLAPDREALYGQVFTCRPDSPAGLVRFAESREYACFGGPNAPADCRARVRGSVTTDNDRYGRYAGEIQLCRADYPADERVNVIGRVPEQAMLLADSIPRGGRFALVRP